MKLWKDTLIGVIAGVAAAGVLLTRRGETPIPSGIYQAQLDLPKYREMAMQLRPQGPSAIQQKLGKRLGEFHMRETALDGTLQYIQDVSDMNIEVEWGALEAENIARNMAVRVDLKNPTASEAIRAVLESAGRLGARLAFQVEGDRVRVSTSEALSRDTLTRAYDIREIIRGLVENDTALLQRKIPPGALLELPGPDGGRGLFGASPTDSAVASVDERGSAFYVGGHSSPRMKFGDFITSAPDAEHKLVRLIEERIDPASWRNTGGSSGAIFYFGGKLIITQTRQNHEDIALLLQWIKDEVAAPAPPSKNP